MLFGFFGVLFVLPVMAADADTLHLKGTIVFPGNVKPEGGFAVRWKLSDGTSDVFYTDSDGKYDQNVNVSEDTVLTLDYTGCEPVTVEAKKLQSAATFTFVCVPEELDSGVVTDYSVSGQMGCDKEDNEFIAPDLALCTVHAYNGGWDKNPTNELIRSQMKEIIALKTTFMTQQMNKQYEYLESMIRRFKVQLEKAILTTRLQKAGAGKYQELEGESSYSSVGLTSGDRSIHIDGVENCNNKLSPAEVVACLNDNLNTISNATNYGNKPTTGAKKQFVNDYKLLVKTDPGASGSTTGCGVSDEKTEKCFQANMNVKTFRECMENMRACLRNVSYELSKQEKQMNYWQLQGK